MTKYRIKAKRDFGNRSFLINGKLVSRGFVVTDGFCNVMPGATWFQTIDDAMRALKVWIGCNGNSKQFWDELRL